MKPYTILLFVLVAIASFSCNNPNNAKTDTVAQEIYQPAVIQPDTTIYIILNDSVRDELAKQGRRISYQAKLAIKSALQNAIQNGGMEHALEYCNLNAMEITDSISLSEKENVQIKRLAKKYRNPLNETNENESNIFKSYIIAWINGNILHPMVIPGENNHPVFYKPITVENLCLNCHGTPDGQITPELTKKIAELYPDDKAINFKTGELRGLWSITFLDYVITDVK